MKIRILFISLLCNLLITATAKNVYTYNLSQISPQTVIEEQKHYAYPGTSYQFIVNIANYNGFAVGTFKLELTNGKFDDGKIDKTVSNGESVSVIWNDTPNVNAGIKITKTTVNYPADDSLKAGIKQIMFYKIASLKGQTPVLTFNGNPNQAIGNKQQFTAIVNEMIYPGIMDTTFGVITNRKVKYFQWKLPDGWKTTNNQTGTFITSSGVRQIDVIPDYVNQGTITVKGVNDLYTGFSEPTSFFSDRGFLFTNYPTSINFGDNSAKTFGTTLFSGIYYEWSAPSGWQINGQGNSLEVLNLNSVNVVPMFCPLTEDRVRVRLKKSGEVSAWYDCNNYQGVLEPTITASGSVYQFEEVSFTLTNVSTSSVQSVTWSGDGVLADGTYKIMYPQPGAQTLYATVLYNGCATPKIIKKEINVLPHRVSLTGPSMFCNQGAYTVNNLSNGATVSWTSDIQNIVSIQSSGNIATLTKIKSGIVKLGAKLYYGQNNYLNLNIDVSVSPISAVGLSSYNNLFMLDGDGVLFRILPSMDAYRYRGSLVVSAGSSNSFTWSQVSSYPNDIKWSANGASVDVYSRFANKTIVLKCRATSTCNTSSKNYTFTTNSSIVEPMSISPNPAINEVTVSLDEDEDEDGQNLLSVNSSEITQKKSYTIQLWSSTGLIRSVISNEPTYTLSLQGVPAGFYYVHMTSGDKTYRKQLIVK